jgi:hypothetical protein
MGDRSVRQSILGIAVSAVLFAATSAQAAIVVPGGPGEITALYMTKASEVSTSYTPTPDLSAWLGLPGDDYLGLGAYDALYNLRNYRVIDGAGQDFNVYETSRDNNSQEWHLLRVLVSADGLNFFDVTASRGAALNLAGDGVPARPTDRQSFDIGAAVAASGRSEFRYIRLQGLHNGPPQSFSGFDLDSMGVANFTTAVPEPAAWALMVLAFGGAGAALRRRRSVPA